LLEKVRALLLGEACYTCGIARRHTVRISVLYASLLGIEALLHEATYKALH